MRNIDRSKVSHVTFVEAQKIPTGRKLVVYHIEYLAIHSWLETG
jgi:hypothetical protein